MNLTLWIIAGALTAAYTTGALAQLGLTKARYRATGPSQHWVDDFSDEQIKIIGAIKLTCCLGLILPGALGIAPVLTPLAACGLALLMAGAATTRFRRMEWKYLTTDVLYLSLFALLAWGRFDLHPF